MYILYTELETTRDVLLTDPAPLWSRAIDCVVHLLFLCSRLLSHFSLMFPYAVFLCDFSPTSRFLERTIFCAVPIFYIVAQIFKALKPGERKPNLEEVRIYCLFLRLLDFAKDKRLDMKI
jgi:hypothetical protein